VWRVQDPFRGGDNIIVMADAYEPPRDIDGKHTDMKPIPTNTRYACAEVMKKAEAEIPWFGIEQVNYELP
jgi:glutamine synthetase